MTHTCKNCKWYFYFKGLPHALCKRYPEQVKTHNANWCGEFKQKDEGDDQA